VHSRPIEFTELKPRIWQQLHSIYEAHASLTSKEVAGLLVPPLENAGFSSGDSARIAEAFVRSFDAIAEAKELGEDDSSPDYESASSPSGKVRLILSLLDVNCLRAMLADEPSYDARRLLVAFTAWNRAHPHPSGWIRYDRPAIMCLAGLSGLRPSEQEGLTQLLHRSYGLDMQVVGSNSPIPCFRLSWLEEEEPVCQSNPIQDIGPLSPAFVSYTVCEVLGLPPSTDTNHSRAARNKKAASVKEKERNKEDVGPAGAGGKHL
jgi:hypothetical protein